MRQRILVLAFAVVFFGGLAVVVRAESADWIFEDEIDEMENAGALSEESAQSLRESFDRPSFAASSRTLAGEWRTDYNEDWKSRLIVADRNGGFRFGTSFLRSRVKTPRKMAETLQAREEQKTVWNKAYAGRQFGEDHFFQRAYIGNFRCGFFDDASEASKESIEPDDRLSPSAAVSQFPEQGRSAHLRGGALQVGRGPFTLAVFTASDRVPAFVAADVAKEDGRITHTSGSTILDMADFRASGLYLSSRIGDGFRASVFAIQADLDPLVPVPGNEGFLSRVVGVQSAAEIDDFKIRTVFARSIGGRFLFGKACKDILGSAKVWAEGKVRDSGFGNPVGNLFSGREPWKVLYGFSVDTDRRTRVSFQSSQFEKDGKVSGRIYAQAKRQIDRTTEVEIGQSFFNRENTEDPDSGTADRWQSYAALKARPFRDFESRFRVTASGKNSPDGQTKVSEQIKMQAVFHFSAQHSFSGEIRYSGDSASSADMDRESVRCEWRGLFGKILGFKFRFERRSRAVTAEIPSGPSEVLVRRDTWDNLVSACATVRW